MCGGGAVLWCIACHSCAAVLRAHVTPLPHVPWAQSRRAAIMAHNKDPSQTWKRTINRFADRTDEERARVNGGGLVRALRGDSVVRGACVMCMPRNRWCARVRFMCGRVRCVTGCACALAHVLRPLCLFLAVP